MLEKYPAAKVVVTAKAKTMMVDLFGLPEAAKGQVSIRSLFWGRGWIEQSEQPLEKVTL